jgi:hypothetical protein
MYMVIVMYTGTLPSVHLLDTVKLYDVFVCLCCVVDALGSSVSFSFSRSSKSNHCTLPTDAVAHAKMYTSAC